MAHWGLLHQTKKKRLIGTAYLFNKKDLCPGINSDYFLKFENYNGT